jgi:hypothetical protein
MKYTNECKLCPRKKKSPIYVCDRENSAMGKICSCDFTETELWEGCRRCIDNVKGLLHSASLLLDNTNSQQYALGLYIYAIEEYGKAILLKSYITGNKDKYQIPGWTFGKGKPTIKSIEYDSVLRNLLWQLVGNPNLKSNTIAAHYAKLIIGSNNLPPECSFNPREIRISTAIQSRRVIDLNSNRKIVPGDWTTGSFVDTTHIYFDTEKLTLIELDLKTSCFYMDWDEDNQTWKYDVATDPNKLKKNIKYFEETLRSFNCTRQG